MTFLSAARNLLFALVATGIASTSSQAATVGLADLAALGISNASIDPVQTYRGVNYDGYSEYSGTEGPDDKINGLRAQRKSLQRIRAASRRFKRELSGCGGEVRRNNAEYRDCFGRAIRRYTNWVSSGPVILQRKQTIVRSLERATAATVQSGSPRQAARAAQRSADEIRATIPLITIADDLIADQQARAVELIAADMEFAAAELIQVQGVFFHIDAPVKFA